MLRSIEIKSLLCDRHLYAIITVRPLSFVAIKSRPLCRRRRRHRHHSRLYADLLISHKRTNALAHFFMPFVRRRTTFNNSVQRTSGLPFLPFARHSIEPITHTPNKTAAFFAANSQRSRKINFGVPTNSHTRRTHYRHRHHLQHRNGAILWSSPTPDQDIYIFCNNETSFCLAVIAQFLDVWDLLTNSCTRFE